ncbi:MAG: ABC transporter ATP-binding protein [Desulfarculaceae bacterium]|nr:ABC transporter ATP-binding protein [Desulfarculaceae bacterium]MCF8071525.1 ABC transporter ATP-binding protein [Desulfarculaceae bacterium]MCF8102340.1 ABC transporter ATP-binding protein [Desulfarculaceae bacterium]MCF8114804.1 ABC transporter ATP-binding protein [Desulfarculaceae bacterium]
MLDLKDIRVFYDHVPALRGVSLTVDSGEIVALIGANGAGKSTTLRAIQGMVKVASGEIAWQGQRLTGSPPHQVVRHGIAHCPEGRQVFPDMTIAENLNMGGMVLGDAQRRQELTEYVYERFPRLAERPRQMAGSLSGGEQQMLAIGRALMADPKLLMLDEPSMGLAPILVESIFEMIRTINQEGISILLVEQNAYMALEHSTRAYVIESGKIGASGLSRVLLDDEYVREAYLGI